MMTEQEKKAEQARRDDIVEFIFGSKMEGDPLSRADIRLAVDVATSIWERTQADIMAKADTVPENIRTLMVGIALKELVAAASQGLDLMAVSAGDMLRDAGIDPDLLGSPDEGCDCPVCEYRKALHSGEDMTTHPITAELLARGYEVVAQTDGALLLQSVKRGKPH